jgi:IS30 family transposase
MAGHKRFTLAVDIKVCLCDPQNQWQLESNENTNELQRQYLTKGIDLAAYLQSKLNVLARKLNKSPRKTSDY